MRGIERFAKVLAALGLIAALHAAGLLTVRQVSADASGCSLVSGGKAGRHPTDNLPECLPGGSGCYECAYSHTSQSGYDICAEENGGIDDCTLNTSTIPDWWPDPDPGVQGPEPTPPGDNPSDSGGGDDGGGVDPGDGGGGGIEYLYDSYVPPSYLYGIPVHRPYDPLSH
jgi:hypothetical protein